MKKNRMVPLCIAALALALAGCGDSTSPPPVQPVAHKPSPPAPTKQTPPPAQPVASKPSAPKQWPFLEESAEGKLAANMLSKNYILVYDGSGSMSDVKCSDNKEKIEVARQAVAEWVKTVPPEANVGLVAFHNATWTVRPLEAGQRDEFIRAVRDIRNAGNTPLGEAFKYAYAMMTEQGKKQMGYGDYVIVTITDGEANDSDSDNRLDTWVNRILKSSPVTIYTIGFCIAGTHSLNQPGRTLYKAANNPQELKEGLHDVTAEADFFDVSTFK